MDAREGLDDVDTPAAEDEDSSPGTCARAQAPARLNAPAAVSRNEEKSVTLLDALRGPTSIEKGMRGIQDEVGLGGEVEEVGEERGDVLVVVGVEPPLPLVILSR
jgi:hypothetical protein